MELYIDKENLKRFIIDKDNPSYEDCYEDCYRMLKRQICINYNFEKSRDLLEDPYLGPYFMLSSQGCGTSETINSYSENKFPQRPIKSNIANGFSSKQHSAIFLIDDERTNSFLEEGNALVGTVGKEIEILKSLFCGNDYDFHKLYNLQSSNSFPRWEQLRYDGLNLPLSDIIIMDRYIGSQNELIEFNLFKIIDILLENVHSKVNLVLLCDKSRKINNTDVDFTDWDELRLEIGRRIKKSTGKRGNVTIIFYPKSDHKHDRTIFTNYMIYRSGDSFCYFNKDGQIITNGNSLDVDSLAKKSNYDFAMSFISSIQKLCDNLKKLNNEMIVGDRKSNYINF